jgi:hypothetical protein
MKQISTKRTVQLAHYKRVKAELEIELKDKGEWRCFFSGIPIPDYMTWKDVSWHHLIGRDGDLLTDIKYLRPVLDKFHTGDEGYHNKPFSYLKTLSWWNGFMERLKALDEDLWYSHVLKCDK